MSFTHAFSQLSTVTANGLCHAESAITLPQLTAAQERAAFGIASFAFLVGAAAVAMHAFSQIGAFQ